MNICKDCKLSKRCVMHLGGKIDGCKEFTKKQSKYNNKKSIIDGIVFDSIAEGRRYQELKLLEKAGHIEGLTLQPKYLLQESFKVNGKTERAIFYIADFAYFEKDNNVIIVEDCKGMKTEAYKIKRKLFLKKYPEVIFVEVEA